MKVLVILLMVELFSLCLGRSVGSNRNGQGYGNSAARSNGYGNGASWNGNGNSASNGYGSNGNGGSNGYGSNGNNAANGYGSNGNGGSNGYGSNGNSASNGYGSNGNGASNSYGSNGNGASSGYGKTGNWASKGYGANNVAMNGYGAGNGFSAPAVPCSHPGKLRGATGSLVYEECVPAEEGGYVYLSRRCAPGTAFDPWEGNCSAIDPNYNPVDTAWAADNQGQGYANNGAATNGYGSGQNGATNGHNGNGASSGYGNTGNAASNGHAASNGGNGYSAPAVPCSHPGKLRGATGSLVYEECVPAEEGGYVYLARRCAPGTAFDPWEGNCSAIDPNFNPEPWTYGG